MSGTTDLTSITSTTRDAACQASTSMEPRSPRMKECRLEHDLPAKRSKLAGDEIDEPRVLAIEESVQRLTVPVQAQIRGGTQCLRHLIQVSGRHRAARAAFDPGDLRGTEVGLGGQVLLAPATTQAEGADAATEANQIHHRMVNGGPYPPITARSRGRRTIGRGREVAGALQSARCRRTGPVPSASESCPSP